MPEPTPQQVTLLDAGQIQRNANLADLASSRPGLIPNCFIINARDSSKRVAFVSMPSSISQGFSAEWDSNEAPGLIEPIRVFKATKATTLAFKLQFYAQGNAGTDVVAQIDILRSFTVSTTERIPGGGSDSQPTQLPPPLAFLIIGTFIRSFVIVKSVDVEWMEPFTTTDIMPMVAEASLNMEIVQFATSGANTGINELASDQLFTTLQPLNQASRLQ